MTTDEAQRRRAPAGAPLCPDEVIHAVREGDRATLERFLADRPDLARGQTPDGVSVLLFALYNGRSEIGGLLREHRETLDLFEAAAVGDLAELRRELGERPEAVDDRSPDGFTALHLAAFFGQGRAARVLLAAGADVEATAGEQDGLRPLHSAAASRQAGIVRLLLGAGADPDARQPGGYTAMHSAAKHGDLPMAMALLASGADPSIPTDDGADALSFAREAEAERIEELIRSSPYA